MSVGSAKVCAHRIHYDESCATTLDRGLEFVDVSQLNAAFGPTGCYDASPMGDPSGVGAKRIESWTNRVRESVLRCQEKYVARLPGLRAVGPGTSSRKAGRD